MPTYDYQCSACGHEFELFQQMSAPVKKKCPECGELKLQRLIGTGAGVLFKGSGFYETDYRSDSYRKAAEADKKSSEPASKSEKKSESSSESKKEAKTQTKSDAGAPDSAPAKKTSSSKPGKASGSS